MAERLHFEVGDKVIIYFMNSEEQERTRLVAFDVVGIFNSGFQEFDKTFVIADISQIQRLNKWKKDEVGGFEVFVKDFNKIEEVGGKVYRETDFNLDAQTIIQQYPSIFEWFSLFDFNIALIRSEERRVGKEC